MVIFIKIVNIIKFWQFWIDIVICVLYRGKHFWLNRWGYHNLWSIMECHFLLTGLGWMLFLSILAAINAMRFMFISIVFKVSCFPVRYSDGVHFWCVTQDLGNQHTDLYETLGVYRVDHEIMHRHISDFRFWPRTGSELFFVNRKFKISKSEVRNFPDRIFRESNYRP